MPHQCVHLPGRRDVSGSFCHGIGCGRLPQDDFGERLEASIASDGCPRAALRSKREVDIFEHRQRLGRGEAGAQRVSQQIAFLEGCRDGPASLLERVELGESIADGGDCDFVQ